MRGETPIAAQYLADVSQLQDSGGKCFSLRFSVAAPARCAGNYLSNFWKIKRHDPGYSVIRYHVVIPPDRILPPSENSRRLPRVRARTRGLRKFQIRKFPRRRRGHHRFPKKPPTSRRSLVPVSPTAAARNFRQRDFSNFHCTSQRDFPHANGMRNVR